MITPYNILHHELVGLTVEVAEATHAGYAYNGMLVDETSKTLTIKTGNRERVIPKDCVTLDIVLPDGPVVRVDGKLLMGGSADRIKKRYRIIF